MATDVYIKFGTTKEKIGPRDTPRPKIEGDSTDDLHYWWCEIRGCGFDLEAKDADPAPAEGGGNKEEDKEKSKAKFHKVTLKKRVDWASTQLFMACCQQAMALSKPRAEQEESWIDIVSIEVCRPSPGDKIPFVCVDYYGVRLIHYSIEMSGPEPSESITFEFQKVWFEHTRTDPYTGNEILTDAATRTGLLENSGTGQSGTAQGSGSEPGAAPGSTTGTAPTGGGGTVNSVANATLPAPPNPANTAQEVFGPGQLA